MPETVRVGRRGAVPERVAGKRRARREPGFAERSVVGKRGIPVNEAGTLECQWEQPPPFSADEHCSSLVRQLCA
jgi:hypothetical protein